MGGGGGEEEENGEETESTFGEDNLDPIAGVLQ